MNENEPDILWCPVCAFIAGMYIQSGLRTVFEHGSLALPRINNQFRKAAQEFLKDPDGATKKYLRPLQKQIQDSNHIHIPDKKIRTFDNFPFIFFTEEEVKKHRISIGKEFTLQGKTLEVKRKVYYMMATTPEMREKYGHADGDFVCFFVENME